MAKDKSYVTGDRRTGGNEVSSNHMRERAETREIKLHSKSPNCPIEESCRGVMKLPQTPKTVKREATKKGDIDHAAVLGGFFCMMKDDGVLEISTHAKNNAPCSRCRGQGEASSDRLRGLLTGMSMFGRAVEE